MSNPIEWQRVDEALPPLVKQVIIKSANLPSTEFSKFDKTFGYLYMTLFNGPRWFAENRLNGGIIGLELHEVTEWALI